MSFVVVFYVTDVWREEVSTTTTAILPYLFDFHLVCVDTISYTTRVGIFCWAFEFFEFCIIVMVVETHYITVRCDYTSVLFILPFEIISYRFEEVFLFFFGPVVRVTDDPVKGACFVVKVDHSINVTSGECKGICVFVVPYSIVMEPVFIRVRASSAIARC